MMRFSYLSFIFLASLFLTACDDDPTVDVEEDAYCGNGIVEYYEECDDGNDDPLDGCHQCRLWSPPSGEPLEVGEVGEWTWFPFEDSVCRDGSSAGFSMRLGTDPSKVMMFFEGGGACFEAMNCAANPKNVPDHARFPGGGGIFHQEDERNPYSDWTWVYFPYCSGDVFVGNTSNVAIKHLDGVQQFLGDANMRLFLDRLVPTIGPETVDELSVVGISAGGIAAVVNTKRLAREFPNAHVTVLDDGGPPLKTDVVSSCMQSWWHELWELEKSVLADCGAGCKEEGDLLFPVTEDLLASNEKLHFGLFSFRHDAVVRLLFSFGQNNCRMVPWPLMRDTVLENGLFDFRDSLESYNERFGTFYAPGSGHVCVLSDCLFNTNVDGVFLYEWIQDLLAREGTHVGQR